MGGRRLFLGYNEDQMIETNIGQIYREESRETEAVMFPKGVRQLLGWAYAMEVLDPHEPSVHAKMIEKMDAGLIRPVNLAGVNVKGLSGEKVFGLAAGIRSRVERFVTDEQRMVIWAYYCDSGGEVVTRYKSDDDEDEEQPWDRKSRAMWSIARDLSGVIRRDVAVIADCVWHVVCTEKQREECTLYAISHAHGRAVSPSTLCRDLKQIRRYMGRVEDSAHVRIKNAYPGGDII